MGPGKSHDDSEARCDHIPVIFDPFLGVVGAKVFGDKLSDGLRDIVGCGTMMCNCFHK
jgi:hypothetical protein